MIEPHSIYVPVLKVKRGEKRALREIDYRFRHHVTPLLEIVELSTLSGRTFRQHLDTTFRDLAASVLSYPRCFIDCRELQPDWTTSSQDVFDRAASENIVFTPVTGLTRNNEDIDAALRYRQQGMALRVTRPEFESGALSNLDIFLSRYNLVPEQIDLIVDLGAVDDMVAVGVASLAAGFLNSIPYHTRWRTFTISACGFPLSMGRVQRNSYDLVQRVDWMAWRNNLYQMRQGLPRLPLFSDCAIQHTSGVEGFDPRIMQVSAAIRYTRSDSWLLIKGESTRISPASRQFPYLATGLVYGYLQPYFYGADHCVGCESIQNCADGAPRHGSAEVWRRYGTIHHITRAVEDLAALSWP